MSVAFHGYASAFGYDVYGQEQQAQGGGDQSAGVAAVADGIGAGLGAVVAGVAHAESPAGVSKEQTLRFVGAMNSLEQLQQELARTMVRHRAAVGWLRNPLNKLRWMTGSVAMNAAPANRKLCPPVYPWIPPLPPQPQRPNPGGWAYGKPWCKCPTEDCAFTIDAKPLVPAKKIEARETELLAYKIRFSRPAGLGTYKDGLGPNAGNIRAARREAMQAWSLLMSLDAMSSLFTMAGVMADWRPPNLTSRAALRLLFPDDDDAKAGRIPAEVANRALATGLTQYAMGRFPRGYTMPLWVYGFTPEQARDISIGPTIAQVAAVQATSPPVETPPAANRSRRKGRTFAGDDYGYGAVSSGLRDRLHGLIATGQIRNVPEAPPSAVPGVVVEEFNQTVEANRGWSTGAKVAVGAAAAAVVGTAAWWFLAR